ncbi:hypothetical protein [Moraxella catarrhalis]|uniref:hypothetical protein n=1 Tax=Moraxella catarrhalis TaxID=480 RepID=UPI0009C2B134|nr:hypothetical protein [Moraxella catarrhalis]ARE66975.1 hypothetical protein MC195_09360 [Moraxella catarrhalis]MPW68388.1 hypothetical protein [Moraxella catarrhalis]MPX27847.1 hypothetical protein [Moraxella catarrhalis]MPX57060.1 hypothetical protein [Moraxella catarrhalis]MPX68918.1 hypothetical protein [Moraxella catarrhalis]
MYIDSSKSYSREELEKAKMVIDITKVLHDMEMDKQRYENDRMERQAQLNAEAEERKVRIAKMQAEQAKIIKETKLYPWVAFAIAIIALCATLVK